MDVKELYKQKFTTVGEAVGQVKTGDNILYMGTMGEPITFLQGLEQIKDKVSDLTIYNSLPLIDYDFYDDPIIRESVEFRSTFFSRFYTKYQQEGFADYIPCHLRNSGTDIFEYFRRRGESINIFVVHVTPMDEKGYFNTGPVSLYLRDVVEIADMIIVEINENLPYTYGETYLHVSEVDYIFQGNNEMVYLPSRPISETDHMVGQNIASLINNGDTIQLGIGGIPNAVAEALTVKKDLGVHTEMLNDAIVGLYKTGAITNRKKTLYKDRMVTTFTYGNKETYDFLNYNQGVLHLNVSHVNSPAVLAQNDNMVSINTTLQVDLMGQCASEALGTVQISGTGGQAETAIGAQMAKNGRSIIALHSTANIRNKEGGRDRISTIKPIHEAGTTITLSRSDVDYVVTENGIADLRGATLRERALELIKIAHPDFRAELKDEARRLHLL